MSRKNFSSDRRSRVFLEIQPTVLPWGSFVSPFSWLFLCRCEAVGFARAASAVGATGHDESFWQKVKDFFTGESHDEGQGYDYHEASSGMDWTDDRANYYYSGINAGGALVSVTGSRTDEARRILQRAGGDL